LTDYNEGQKENSGSHNTYFAGKTGTGKGQLSGWAKEHGIASGNLKVFEAHASQPAHLEELFQFLFPNGFLLNYDSLQILDSVLEQFDRGAYSDGNVDKTDVNELYQMLDEGHHPEKRVEKIEELLDSNPARSLKLHLQEVKEKEVEIRKRIKQLREGGYKYNDLPDTFQKSYADGVNRGFDVEVLVPISDSMPTCDVPDFFTPFAIPINDYARHEQLEEGLKIIFGNQYEDYSKIYDKVVDDSSSFEDVKNVESLGGKEYIQQGSFAGETFQVTETNIEDQQLEAFQRRFDKLFSTRGIVCSPDFEHRLRPKLKDVMLDNEPDIVILYTGFLSNDPLRKFVITYFLETYEDIIQNLKPSEVTKLDKKFVVSGIEAQEWVKESNGAGQNVHDRVPRIQVDRMMDNCRHFNTEFWFDVKPDKIHDIILSKASDRFATSMNEGDVDEFSWNSTFKTEYKKAIDHIPYNSLDDSYPELGYGFVYLEGTSSVPDWKRNGRKQYGHRMPTPRMCVQDPVDRFSMDNFSFFLQFDRWDPISFQDYQRQLFKEDWESNAEPYLEEEEKREKRKQQEEEEREEEMKNLRKNAAISKLETKVEKNGEVPDQWKSMLEEVRDEMIEDDIIEEDFSYRTILDYTKERREELKEEFETRRPDDFDYQEVARDLVQDKEFVFGGSSKDDKQVRAKEFILEEFPECGERAAEEDGEKAADKAVRMLQTEGILNNSYQTQIDRDRFEREISEAFEFAEFETVEDEVDAEEDQGSSSESNTQEEDVDEEPEEPADDSGYRTVKITASVPEFKGPYLEDYGPFEEGDVAELPSENAEILLNRGKAVKHEESEESEGPGEEWRCNCGAINGPERSVCRNCTKEYGEADPVN